MSEDPKVNEAQNEEPKAEVNEEFKEVFNNGKRPFSYKTGQKDSKGKDIIEQLTPGEKATIPSKEAEKLMRMFPTEVALLKNMALVDASAAKLKAAQARITQLEETLAEKEDALNKARKELAKNRTDANTLVAGRVKGKRKRA